MKVMFFNPPLKAYVFGMTYEVRDSVNRKVLVFQMQSGDYQYRKDLAELTKIVAEVLTAYFSDKLAFAGGNMPEVPQESKKEAIPSDLEVSEQGNNEVVNQELVEEKKRRGRPRKK